MAGEAADRGRWCSLSNRGKHQVYQQRLRPQADPQVRPTAGDFCRRSWARFLGRSKDLRTDREKMPYDLCGVFLFETAVVDPLIKTEPRNTVVSPLLVPRALRDLHETKA